MKNAELIIARHAEQILGTSLRMLEDRLLPGGRLSETSPMRETYDALTEVHQTLSAALLAWPR